MSSFAITTAQEFLSKLIDEESDLKESHSLSSRHALNATMTAYHLYEWVWGGLVKRRADLHTLWKLKTFSGKKDRERFFKYLLTRCPALDTAEKIANGTKHFDRGRVSTGSHKGDFSPEFSRDFDTSYLWVARSDRKKPTDADDPRQYVEDFIRELVEFWKAFFVENDFDVP
jgi:hypothetical protein